MRGALMAGILLFLQPVCFFLLLRRFHVSSKLVSSLRFIGMFMGVLRILVVLLLTLCRWRTELAARSDRLVNFTWLGVASSFPT
jgi:hypothetical protein